MKKLLVMVTAFLGFALANFAIASIPNYDNPATFLGPTIKGSYTDSLRVNSAYSVLGEAGWKNFRVGGTVGWALDVNQRFKFSGEYLVQKITYPFFAGNTDQWVYQGAIGAGYQYDFVDYAYEPQFNLSGFLSHAPSKNLNPVIGNFFADGISQSFYNYRRIAGSNAGGIAPGIGFQPWLGGIAMFDLNYDKVKYDKQFSPNQNAIGFGGTIRLSQAFTDTFGGGISAAVRKPFNNYQADLFWHNVPYVGNWDIGAFGAYTAGKNTLPNTYNIGVSFDLIIDRPVRTTTGPIRQSSQAQLTHWISKPAVYLPQVLAIPDEDVISPRLCAQGVPTVIGTLPDLPSVTSTIDVPTASVFTGSGLSYTVSATPDPAPSTVTVNSTTGVVTINPSIGGSDVTFTVTVTATNSCGSASTSFDATIPGD